MHDEDLAKIEIKNLSKNAKMHLQDVCRNFAQVCIDTQATRIFMSGRVEKFIKDLEEVDL